MKITLLLHTLLIIQCLAYSFPSFCQSLQVEGDIATGSPGNGNTLLTLVSERNWAFRQFGTGPSTALELADLTGLKNFIINTTANVGIGVSFPIDKLHVDGDIRAEGDRISFGSSEYFEDGGFFIISCNGTLISAVDGADDLGSASNRWRNVWATSGTINTSDARMKSDIRDIRYGLKDLLRLHPVSFVWKDHPENGSRLGLIAQEVQGVIPEVVVDHEFRRDEKSGKLQKIEAGNLGLYYSDLIPILIRGVQEQQQLIDEKDARITLLESRAEKVDALEERLARLERLLPQVVEKSILMQGDGVVSKLNNTNSF